MAGERIVNGLHVSQDALQAYARTLAVLVVETDEVEVVLQARIVEEVAPVPVNGAIEMRAVRRVVVDSAAQPEVRLVFGIHEAALPWPEQVRRMQLGEELAEAVARELKATTALPKAPWEVAADAAERGGSNG